MVIPRGSRELQQVLNKIFAPNRFALDAFERGKEKIVLITFLHDDWGKAENDPKRVVDLVGHTPGQLADSRHFFRLPEPFCAAMKLLLSSSMLNELANLTSCGVQHLQ